MGRIRGRYTNKQTVCLSSLPGAFGLMARGFFRHPPSHHRLMHKWEVSALIVSLSLSFSLSLALSLLSPFFFHVSYADVIVHDAFPWFEYCYGALLGVCVGLCGCLAKGVSAWI